MAEVEKRQDAVSYFVARSDVRIAFLGATCALPDLERLSCRCVRVLTCGVNTL